MSLLPVSLALRIHNSFSNTISIKSCQLTPVHDVAILNKTTAKFSVMNLRILKVTSAILVNEIGDSPLDIQLQMS